MPSYHVQRTISIDKDIKSVRDVLTNYQDWPKWSPWLFMEPTAKLEYRGDAGVAQHGYKWNGDVVGSGDMILTSVSDNKLMMDLQFFKPFKSKAKVAFDLKSTGANQTEVTWHMDGALPIFLFFMTKMMKAMIGNDYERGLKMLKDYLEKGEVWTKSELEGVVDIAGQTYVGIRRDDVPMKKIGDAMKEDFPALVAFVQEHGLEQSGVPMSVTHKVNLVKGICSFSAAIPVSNPKASGKVSVGKIEPCRALKITHTGAYHHLANPWSMAENIRRNKKLKPAKQACFERYISDPGEVDEKDLVTEIYTPVRA